MQAVAPAHASESPAPVHRMGTVELASVWAGLAIVLAGQILGTFGALDRVGWTIVAAIIGAGLLVLLGRGRDRVPAGADPDAPSPLFVAVLGGLLLGRAIYSLRNPPADWDSVQYHLPMVGHWLISGTLSVPPREPPAVGAYYPGNGEVLQAFLFALIRRDTLVAWPGIAALGVLALALRRLALLAGAKRVVAESVVLAFATSPGIVSLTFGTRIDFMFAAWLAVGWLALALASLEMPGPYVATGLVALGLACGAKGSGPVIVFLILAAMALGRRIVGIPQAELRGERIGLAWPVLLSVIPGFYWMVRNAALSGGNPIYPFQAPVIDAPYFISSAWLQATTQIHVWRSGYAGHLTASNLTRMFGWGVWLMIAAAIAGGWRNRGPGDWVARGLALFTLLSFGYFLISPFSGAYAALAPGLPPMLNQDNLRLMFPTMIGLVPLAALGLSLAPAPVALAPLVILIVFQSTPRLGHVMPGIVLVGLVVIATRWRPLAGAFHTTGVRAGASLAAGVATVIACVLVEPRRERLNDVIWDGYLGRLPNASSSALRQIRERAQGRPIAVVGPDAWWQLYGRDLSGRPVYVPIGSKPGDDDWPRLDRDPRPADHAAWLAHLDRIHPAVVLIAPFTDPADSGAASRWREGCLAPIEAEWCERDTTRFRPIVNERCVEAFEVIDGEATAARVP